MLANLSSIFIFALSDLSDQGNIMPPDYKQFLQFRNKPY